VKAGLKTLTGVKVVPGADHWVFLSPCSKELADELPAICSDPPSIDRVQVHAELNEAAKQFFEQTLGR